jgi:hypothetical protein
MNSKLNGVERIKALFPKHLGCLTSVSGRGCVKTRYFQNYKKQLPLKQRLLFIFVLYVQQPGNIVSIVAPVSHF